MQKLSQFAEHDTQTLDAQTGKIPQGGLCVRTDLRAGAAWDEIDDTIKDLWNQVKSVVGDVANEVESIG